MNLLYTAAVTIGSIIIMFIITKLIGNKQISQFTLFDYINGITIGSIAAEMAVSNEFSELWVAAVAMGLYGLVGIIMSYLTMKSIRCRRFIAGTPLMLVEDGKLYPENLKSAKLDIGDLLTRARIAGYFDLSKVSYAILENNGTISFLPKAEEAPLTPKDLGYKKEDDKLVVNIILDGVVMDGNLKHSGKEIKWLTKELREQGYSSPSQIFLATIDQNDTLKLYPQSPQENKKNYFD